MKRALCRMARYPFHLSPDRILTGGFTMIEKIARGYLKIVETICVFLLFMILVCMCIQIGCRILTIGQNFTEELSRICFCILIFLGAPLAYAEGADIAVDMVVNALPPMAKRVIEALVNILVAVFCGLCMRSLVTFIGSNKGVTAVSMTWIQMSWLYYTFFASFACMFLIALAKLIAVLRGRPQTLDINADEKMKMRQEEKEMDLGI